MEFNFVYPDNHDKSTPPGGNDGALDKKIAEYNIVKFGTYWVLY